MTLLTPDGRLDRAAILRDARRQFLVMRNHGWSWRQCVRYSWARAKVQKDRDATACAMGTMKATILADLKSRALSPCGRKCPTGRQSFDYFRPQ